MPEPRTVVVTMAGIRSLTILEIARAGATAGVNRAETQRLLRSLMHPDSDPADLERGATLMYAWAWQLQKRTEDVTWEDAQKWRVEFDLETTDDVADAEADAKVHAAAVTGLTPEQAGQLTLAEMDAYAKIAP